MINRRGFVVVILLAIAMALLAPNARAADPPRLPAGYTCADVRDNVRKYGYWPALLWARANGFTAEQIEQAKRCLRK